MTVNFSQYETGHARVIAGPGTGKTTSLLSLVARRLSGGADPNGMLLLTFSRATAVDLRSQLRDRMASGLGQPRASTLHSYCFSELRKETGSAFVGEVTVDQWETRHLVAEDIGHELGISGAQAMGRLDAYDAAWRTLTPPPTHADAARFEATLEGLRKVYDFALLGETVYKFNRFMDGAPDYRPELDSLFVDEYQDLNVCDLTVIRELSHRSGAETLAFGDDDQCIYAFRHADPDGLARFIEEYDEVGEFELDICYRCPEEIFAAAQRLIVHNGQRLPKTMHAAATGGGVKAHAVGSEVQMRDAVVQLVRRHLEAGTAADEILVLVPRRSLAEGYAQALISGEVPVLNLAAPDPALAAVSVRQLMYALRLAANCEDAVALRGWLRCWPGVGPGRVAAVREGADTPASFRVRCDEVTQGPIATAMEGLASLVRTLEEPGGLNACIARVESEVDVSDAVRGALHRLSSFLGVNPDATGEGEPVVQEALAEEIEEEARHVRVMTMRGAKGLGVDVVLVPDAEQPLIPGDEDVAEQRRLFYVSVTRAKQALHILHVAAPRRSGRARFAGAGHRKPNAYRPRTQFLDEMAVPSTRFE